MDNNSTTTTTEIEYIRQENEALRAEAARDGRVIITDTTDTDIAHDGLKLKCRVYKAENNAPVENCFVLRPMKDRAARIAMEAYAKATENKELSEDIFDVLKILACS